MPALASNFTANSLSGTVRVSAGTANIRLAVEPIAFEGTKQFVVKLRKDSTQGTVISTSSNITIVDTSSIVSVTANTATVLEGNLVSFTISTANVPNNANVYFSILPVTANITAQDFEANVGRFTIINNSATFALKANADLSLMDETGETFKLQVRTLSTVGDIVFTSSNIAISDTSKAFNVIGVTAGNTSPVAIGTSVTFTFTATNVPSGTLFYYSTTGNVSSFTSNTGSFALNSTSNTFVISNPQIAGTANVVYNVLVRKDSSTGDVVATSNTMSVTYLPPPIGQQAYTTAGTYSWTCPAGVTSINVVCIGGGGGYTNPFNSYGPLLGGAGGGELRWKNNITVIPGNSYTVIVGAAGAYGASGGNRTSTAGGTSSFNTSTCVANGGGRGPESAPGGAGGSGGTGDGGGNGGAGGTGGNGRQAGSGGAGGYSGNGGAGGNGNENSPNSLAAGQPGTGGGGGGACGGNSSTYAGGFGGGTGIYGEGPSGAGQASGGFNQAEGGSGSTGGLYGGTGSGTSLGGNINGCNYGDGKRGAVRIIWGNDRQFPATNTGDL